MNANSFPTSKAVVQKRETLPIAAEDGIVITDLALKPIAIDRGAIKRQDSESGHPVIATKEDAGRAQES